MGIQPSDNIIDELVRDIEYPITVHTLPKEDGGGFFAYLPDIGHSACSAAGDTLEEAIYILKDVLEGVTEVYEERGYKIPRPSGDPVNDDFPTARVLLRQAVFKLESDDPADGSWTSWIENAKKRVQWDPEVDGKPLSDEDRELLKKLEGR